MLAALVSGCAEELIDEDSEPLVDEAADTGAGLAAYGATEGTDIIVDPLRGRIDLAISATGPLLPNKGIALTVGGVAREAIDSGEVVLTLPTRALMDHVGEGDPELPAVARWVLPPMAKGDTWSGSYTVPGEAAGYYRAMANAYTHGPDGGLWLFDDVLGGAWMYVSETDGQLTRFFEDSLFPDSVHPMAGPAAGWPTAGGAWTASRRNPNTTTLDPDSVYLLVVYSISEREGFKRAVGAEVEASIGKFQGKGQVYRDLGSVTVPEDGIVAFECPEKYTEWISGFVRAPDTDYVPGGGTIAFWSGNNSHCGQLTQVEVEARGYLPWRLLDLSADAITKHFGYVRGRVGWDVLDGDDADNAYYDRSQDRIFLGWGMAAQDRFHWVAAHEYGHAYHHLALGGLWKTENCYEHYVGWPSSYTCALSEGFANYAGTVGSVSAEHPDGYLRDCFEWFGSLKAPKNTYYRCKNVAHYRKAEVEGWVAALFVDLIDDNDDNDERGDYTELSGRFVAEVFKTCEIKQARWGPLPDSWEVRDDVSDIVWCLEYYIEPAYHEPDSVFDGIDAPEGVHRFPLNPPWGWNQADIRKTWLWNLN